MAQATPRLPKCLPSAFSLVEVTLALGIVSVSLLSLLGLLPAGLGVLRESMDQTARAHIVQRIAAEVVTSDFDQVTSRTLSFDQDGQAVISGQDSFYSVTIQGSAPSLPGLSSEDDIQKLQTHLKRIKIGISRSNIPNAPVAWYAIQVAAR
ncbi:hypothetical protein BH09VER1_BH09VER1_42900 [soil metagenome]